jgi:hypothetical protein
MPLVTYKLRVPFEENAEKIVKTFDNTGIKASWKFVTEIPRHYLLSFEIPDDDKQLDNAVTVGVIIGIYDRS